ncbi:RNA 2',3'-cyclic phosphodiesterase [Virgibacillus sp. DJP39]|uniref:RNA 2',3'-cyclic phosphodiesterase n=1 Tax=Virgibacillus sp. DJP39 TaxID=3409790 RepID=UPI003BB66BC4
MTGNPHYFIALPVPQTIKETVSDWQSDLKESLTYKQWTHKDDLHITLKFLGSVSDDGLKNLIKELHRVEELPMLSLELKGIKTFGKPSSPRVLYANVEKTKLLAQLVGKVENIAEVCGFDKEAREFRAHITIAKKWNDHSLSLPVKKILSNYLNETHEFTVDHIRLYQVHPSRNPKYEVVKSFPLIGGG